MVSRLIPAPRRIDVRDDTARSFNARIEQEKIFVCPGGLL